jgi:molecular chaperone HscA
MLVVDAGAGTTDFALFQSFIDPDTDETSFALISNAVRMSRVAGNRVDSVLRPLVLRACNVHAENGSPWNEEEFRIIKADLSSQIRQLKQQLFAANSVSISLRPGASGVLALEELEQEPSYQELGRNLIDQRDTLLRNALPEGAMDGFRMMMNRVGRALPIYVLLTGGSARLPLVQAIASGTLSIGGVKFEFKPITDTPRWILELPRALSELTAREFAQCAVAIGGSAPELPKEQRDLLAPVTPPPKGVRKLDRFPISGA